jgi:hypothetical protein
LTGSDGRPPRPGEAAGLNAGPGPDWSQDVGQADWIGPRLAPFDSHVVTSVVPGGFPAYARILHPAEDPVTGDRLVRWAAVAAWSGLPLGRAAQFHSVALPPERPAAPAPWSGQGPRAGSLYLPDAAVLADWLRAWTGTPDECWFCVWDGHGWDHTVRFTQAGGPSLAVPDPVAAAIRAGARVRLPHRDYLLYSGPVEAAVATAAVAGDGQTANLWWPRDRAWCAATEIDLPWTYVGGPTGLIEGLAADPRIEALPAGPQDSVAGAADWVTRWAEQAAADLLAAGRATITTSRGTVRAWLTRPAGGADGQLRTQHAGDNGVSGGGSRVLHARGEAELQAEVARYLSWEVVGLVGG